VRVLAAALRKHLLVRKKTSFVVDASQVVSRKEIDLLVA
jgi:hypothetical protein